MPSARSPRYRPVYVLCLMVAVCAGLYLVTFGGGAIAAWVPDQGKTRAAARVLDVEGDRTSGTVDFEFTTGEGRTVRASARRRLFKPGAETGSTVDVLYDPRNPAASARYDQKPARVLPWCALALAVAVLSGAAAYRTRPGAQKPEPRRQGRGLRRS
ncbi:DUF3592 domain-containing protein [Spirillospora sp. NPDC029432]|uniref:DUF3592 domain-containing protein n=1 Tax=Spirillospora sp. NPDC029432 TaxID=3154599 RepID=UPI003456D913